MTLDAHEQLSWNADTADFAEVGDTADETPQADADPTPAESAPEG
ncbi:MAG TPA: hypothetical protein VF163_19245 [Micromonosporaceae bacterium]